MSRLPRRTSISALFSASFLRQDEPLLPFTSNTALVEGAFSNPAFEAGIAPFDTTDPANLPARTANAAIDTRNLQVRVSTKPASDLGLTAQYRFYNLDNHSGAFVIPGVVREDAEWRVPLTPGATMGPLPIAYGKHTASLATAWDLNDKTRLGASYTFERMNRSFREVAWMNDHKLKASLDLTPSSWLELRASYEHIRRNTAPYLHGQAELAHGETASAVLPFLRKFDQAERRTNQGQGIVTVTPNDRLAFSGSVQYGKDDYLFSAAGLRLARRDEYGGDVSYLLTNRLSVYAAYTFEKFRYEMNGRQWTPGGVGDPYVSDDGAGLEQQLDRRASRSLSHRRAGLRSPAHPEGASTQCQLLVLTLPRKDPPLEPAGHAGRRREPLRPHVLRQRRQHRLPQPQRRPGVDARQADRAGRRLRLREVPHRRLQLRGLHLHTERHGLSGDRRPADGGHVAVALPHERRVLPAAGGAVMVRDRRRRVRAAFLLLAVGMTPRPIRRPGCSVRR